MRRALAALAALPVALLPAAPAQAAPMVVATAAERFLPFEVAINQGDTLTLVNLENSPHDLVAQQWEDGAPLFQSDIVGLGGTSEVRGVSTLTPSTYPFYCTVHDTMTGLLTVR